MTEDEQSAAFKKLPKPHRDLLLHREQWRSIARKKQWTPDPTTPNWIYWMLMGGRGAGKTRTGAEDIAWYAGCNPEHRIAIVAPTFADGRDTCVEGHSGLLNVLPNSCIEDWNRSHGELILWNKAHLKIFSAEQPERLRGPQHHRAWCDELGAWRYQDTFDQLMFGLRLGAHPQVVITTTPRPTVLVKKLLKDPATIITRESTYANEKNLPPAIIAKFRELYQGTRLGRQELEAEVLSDVAGALWRQSQIDEARIKPNELPDMQRIVVAIDPATADPDKDAIEGRAETGIIVAGIGVDGLGYVLSDLTCRLSPDGWARRAISGYDMYDADAIVAETNQGGQMVISTIRAVRPTVKVVDVHASRGKVTRAEPISALYEQNRIKHVGSFPDLENQMTSFTSDGIEGDTTGDRVDAMVWAFTELFPKMTRKNKKSDVSVESVSGYQPHSF